MVEELFRVVPGRVVGLVEFKRQVGFPIGRFHRGTEHIERLASHIPNGADVLWEVFLVELPLLDMAS